MNMETVDVAEIAAATERVLGDVARPFIVEVGPSAEDDQLFCVRVFGIPEALHSAVEDAIITLADELFPAGEAALLPMPKTAAVTEEYYPEQYAALLEQAQEREDTAVVFVHRMEPVWVDPLTQRSLRPGVTEAANTELALAA